MPADRTRGVLSAGLHRLLYAIIAELSSHFVVLRDCHCLLQSPENLFRLSFFLSFSQKKETYHQRFKKNYFSCFCFFCTRVSSFLVLSFIFLFFFYFFEYIASLIYNILSTVRIHCIATDVINCDTRLIWLTSRGLTTSLGIFFVCIHARSICTLKCWDN